MSQVMLNRIAAIAVVQGTAGAPGIAAAAGDADVDAVASLANDATEALLEEQALVSELPDVGPPTADLGRRLRTADSRGFALLGEFQELGIELSPSAAIALDRLPPPGQGFPPGDLVYEAAIEEFGRIAATPGAVLPTNAQGSGPAVGLLTVAAVSLLVLGAVALGNALRRRESDEELAAMAWSDGLTGLANRRRFDHDLADYDRNSEPVTSIMVDIDHFKNVNDSFGHHEGDDALRRIATVLAQHVRHDDVVYRYGGEEFCVLLPGASHEDAMAVGSHLTVSVGVAHPDETTASKSFFSADRALMQAKEAGRDRAVDADEVTPDLQYI